MPVTEWHLDPWAWEGRVVRAVAARRRARRAAAGDIRPECRLCHGFGYSVAVHKRLFMWWPYWSPGADGRLHRLPHHGFCPRCISPELQAELNR